MLLKRVDVVHYDVIERRKREKKRCGDFFLSIYMDLLVWRGATLLTMGRGTSERQNSPEFYS